MTTVKFLAAATVLSALIASSASAQPVVMGSPRPAVDAQAMAPRQVTRHPARQARSAK